VAIQTNKKKSEILFIFKTVDGQEATLPRSQYQEATDRSSKKPLASWHWVFD
jgi:hypothetical protein